MHRWADVRTPHVDPPDFDLIDAEVRQALFRQFNPRTFLGARNLAIVALLSDTGVRRQELCLIKHADVNLDELQVRVYAPKTPTRRWRLVPFSEETGEVLAHYVRQKDRFLAGPSRRRYQPGVDRRVHAPRELATDCFFITKEGGQLHGESVESILQRARLHLAAQGFGKVRLHAHLFRHDYITRKALDGEHPSIVKRWVGHPTFAMTDRYFGIAESRLAAVRPRRSVLERIVALPGSGRGRWRRSASAQATPRRAELSRPMPPLRAAG